MKIKIQIKIQTQIQIQINIKKCTNIYTNTNKYTNINAYKNTNTAVVVNFMKISYVLLQLLIIVTVLSSLSPFWKKTNIKISEKRRISKRKIRDEYTNSSGGPILWIVTFHRPTQWPYLTVDLHTGKLYLCLCLCICKIPGCGPPHGPASPLDLLDLGFLPSPERIMQHA